MTRDPAKDPRGRPYKRREAAKHASSNLLRSFVGLPLRATRRGSRGGGSSTTARPGGRDVVAVPAGPRPASVPIAAGPRPASAPIADAAALHLAPAGAADEDTQRSAFAVSAVPRSDGAGPRPASVPIADAAALHLVPAGAGVVSCTLPVEAAPRPAPVGAGDAPCPTQAAACAAPHAEPVALDTNPCSVGTASCPAPVAAGAVCPTEVPDGAAEEGGADNAHKDYWPPFVMAEFRKITSEIDKAISYRGRGTQGKMR